MHGRLNEPLFPQSETYIHMYLGDICMFMYLPKSFGVIFGAYTIVRYIIYIYIYIKIYTSSNLEPNNQEHLHHTI